MNAVQFDRLVDRISRVTRLSVVAVLGLASWVLVSTVVGLFVLAIYFTVTPAP